MPVNKKEFVIFSKDHGDRQPLTINLTNLLDAYNIALSTVNDLYFGLKENKSDLDVDAKFFKTLIATGPPDFPGGITILNEEAVIDFSDPTDFDNLAKDTNYFICMAVQRTNVTWFEELTFLDNGDGIKFAKMRINQDKVERIE